MEYGRGVLEGDFVFDFSFEGIVLFADEDVHDAGM